MLSAIYTIISICSAIVTALCVYKMADEANFKLIASVPVCILAAIIAGYAWLPATLILGIILFKERKTMYQE